MTAQYRNHGNENNCNGASANNAYYGRFVMDFVGSKTVGTQTVDRILFTEQQRAILVEGAYVWSFWSNPKQLARVEGDTLYADKYGSANNVDAEGYSNDPMLNQVVLKRISSSPTLIDTTNRFYDLNTPAIPSNSTDLSRYHGVWKNCRANAGGSIQEIYTIAQAPNFSSAQPQMSVQFDHQEFTSSDCSGSASNTTTLQGVARLTETANTVQPAPLQVSKQYFEIRGFSADVLRYSVVRNGNTLRWGDTSKALDYHNYPWGYQDYYFTLQP